MKDDYPKVLLIEGSGSGLAVGLSLGETLLSKVRTEPRQHTQYLLSDLQALLEEAALDWAQLDAIAFSAGPGSFTGLRLVSSSVQAIAFAHTLPVVTLPSFDIVAHAFFKANPGEQALWITVPAKQAERYWAGYAACADSLTVLKAASIATDEAIKTHLKGLAHPFHLICEPPFFSQTCDQYPMASLATSPTLATLLSSMQWLAKEAIRLGQTESAQGAVPIYLHSFPAPGIKGEKSP